MPASRYPKATWKGDGVTTGTYTGGPWKLVLHTTETAGVPSYNSGLSAPHITYFPRERTFTQHTELTKPARALRDAEGGVATNRDSALQLEIVCYSQESVVDKYPNTGRIKVSELSDEHMNDIREFCRWACDEFGIQWKYPESHARMALAAYDAYNGLLGHKHVPENTHWDPGAFDYKKLMEEGEDMPLTQVDADLVVNTLMARRIWFTPGHNGEPLTPFEVIVSRNYRNLGELVTAHRAGELGTDVELTEEDIAALADAIEAAGIAQDVADELAKRLVS